MSELGQALADGNPIAAIIAVVLLLTILVAVLASSRDTQRYLDEYVPDE